MCRRGSIFPEIGWTGCRNSENSENFQNFVGFGLDLRRSAIFVEQGDVPPLPEAFSKSKPTSGVMVRFLSNGYDSGK